ncbi:hypothetical protein [Variovorax sp. W2I14]|uniref:hypothetical protein n=1 Tax=Variovorax sp. W2I14 TaxID=3042290 RepID=UPI003D2181D9
MKYFSVDRRGVYVAGESISLAANTDNDGDEIRTHINKKYPSGFSRHGAQYFRDAWLERTPLETQSGILELLLECTRIAYYPAKPCRYQSMFACDSIEAALKFRTERGKPEDPIHELSPQAEPHRGDMSIYTLGGTFASIDCRLHLYWQGKTLNIPGHLTQWEYVLPLPVVVGSRVA